MSLERSETSQLKESATQLLNELTRVLKEDESKRNYKVASEYLATFIENLQSAPSDDEDVIALQKSVADFLGKNNIRILSIVHDYKSIENEKSMPGYTRESNEMYIAEKVKKERFHKKGLVINMELENPDDGYLKIKDRFLTSISTEITYIIHWSEYATKSLYRRMMEQTHVEAGKYTEGDPLLFELCPRLADESQSPRLQKLNLLGCATAADSKLPKKESINLYLALATNYKKLGPDKCPCYCIIYDKSTSKTNLNYIDERGNVFEIENSIIPIQEEWKESIIKRADRPQPLVFQGEIIEKYVNLPLMHEMIFHHQNSLHKHCIPYVNGQENLYIRNTMKTSAGKAYLEGTKTDEKKSSVTKLSLFGNKNVYYERNQPPEGPESFGMIVSRMINQDRESLVAVKAYTSPITTKGNRIVPDNYEAEKHHPVKETLGSYGSKSITFKPK